MNIIKCGTSSRVFYLKWSFNTLFIHDMSLQIWKELETHAYLSFSYDPSSFGITKSHHFLWFCVGIVDHDQSKSVVFYATMRSRNWALSKSKSAVDQDRSIKYEILMLADCCVQTIFGRVNILARLHTLFDHPFDLRCIVDSALSKSFAPVHRILDYPSFRPPKFPPAETHALKWLRHPNLWRWDCAFPSAPLYTSSSKDSPVEKEPSAIQIQDYGAFGHCERLDQLINPRLRGDRPPCINIIDWTKTRVFQSGVLIDRATLRRYGAWST